MMGRPPATIDPAELRRLYLEEGLSLMSVALSLGTNRETVRRRLHAEGVTLRPSSYPGMRARETVGPL